MTPTMVQHSGRNFIGEVHAWSTLAIFASIVMLVRDVIFFAVVVDISIPPKALG